MKLRGHHLLCLVGFRGRGYSGAFIRRMAEVKQGIVSAETTELDLVDGPDAICEACPHLLDGECHQSSTSERRLAQKDRLVLADLGLGPGQTVPTERLTALLADRSGHFDLATICSDCDWFSLGYCSQALEQLASEGRLNMGGLVEGALDAPGD